MEYVQHPLAKAPANISEVLSQVPCSRHIFQMDLAAPEAPLRTAAATGINRAPELPQRAPSQDPEILAGPKPKVAAAATLPSLPQSAAYTALQTSGPVRSSPSSLAPPDATEMPRVHSLVDKVSNPVQMQRHWSAAKAAGVCGAAANGAQVAAGSMGDSIRTGLQAAGHIGGTGSVFAGKLKLNPEPV